MKNSNALSELKEIVTNMSEEINLLTKKLEESCRAKEEIQVGQKNMHEECIYGDEGILLPEWFEVNEQVVQDLVKRTGRNLSSQAMSTCKQYHKKGIETFDGPITLGDMVFIAIFIERIKPKTMYEIGVASGYSSAFILNLGKSLGLISDDNTFLHSYDLFYQHSKELNGDENITGEVVPNHFPELSNYWSLNTNKTSFDLQLEVDGIGKSLFFVDGGHEHPWPLLDLIHIYELIEEKDTWVLMQDNRVNERWYQDSRKYNVKMLKPVRGVEIPFTYWPGKKISGKSGCYNMCALNMNIPNMRFAEFVKDVMNYWPQMQPENNYGCAKFREALQRQMGNYEERIKNKLTGYL